MRDALYARQAARGTFYFLLIDKPTTQLSAVQGSRLENEANIDSGWPVDQQRRASAVNYGGPWYEWTDQVSIAHARRPKRPFTPTPA